VRLIQQVRQHSVLCAVCIALGMATAQSWAVGEPEHMSRTEFDSMMQDISNWGRWGKDDELGTLNLITPAVRKAAASLVGKASPCPCHWISTRLPTR